MARALARKNIERVRSARGEATALSLPQLQDGHMKLFNHQTPVLSEGVYGIEAKQIVRAGNEELHIYNYDSVNSTPPPAGQDYPTSLQQFTVIAPRFQLDPKTINSYYPPDGFVEEARILPHIVFNDPHLPWERPLYKPPFRPSVSTIDPFARLKTRPPWIALVIFDPEELKLTQAEGDVLRIPSFQANGQPGSGAFSMKVGEYLTQISSRVTLEGGLPPGSEEWANLQASTDPVSIIFPQKNLIESIFPRERLLNVMYMAHVRQVSSAGLPDAAGQDSSLFSVCVSHRSGPTMGPGSKKPTTQIVHLISIENIIYGPHDPSNSSDRIGMISLFSWTYTSTPPLPTNFTALMKNLADQKQMLRPPNPILGEIIAPTSNENATDLDSGAKLLHQRLSLSYTLSRWRTATGEETAAFVRGPLVPVPTSTTPSAVSPSDWPHSSYTGKDYQILDKALGLFDMTYSTAWQLGKMLAMLDTTFYQALFRFRSLIHKSASSELRMTLNGLRPAREMINRAPNIMGSIHSLAQGQRRPQRSSFATQHRNPSTMKHPHITALSQSISSTIIDNLTRSADNQILSDYYSTTAKNTDWSTIHAWISDKLFLSGIPFHYLITDPSHLASTPIPFSSKEPIRLPPEALRFFHIDDAWLDCLIDGALSVANHFSAENDSVRQSIKETYNLFLRTNIPGTNVKPPVPRYGFFIRSLLVKAILDLRITITVHDTTTMNSAPALLRLTRVDENTILALLDCKPEDIQTITLTQPPHQQRFTAPIPAVPGVPFQIKRIFTRGAPEGEWPPLDPSTQVSEQEAGNWYDANTRVVQVGRFVESLRRVLPFSDSVGGEGFDADVGSAVVGLELNDRCYGLEIGGWEGEGGEGTGGGEREVRQLWTGGSLGSVGTFRADENSAQEERQQREQERLRERALETVRGLQGLSIGQHKGMLTTEPKS